MATSAFQDRTEPAVFVPEVAKQRHEFVGAIAFGVFVSTRASFWLDKIIRKLVKFFNEDLPKPKLVVRTELAHYEEKGKIGLVPRPSERAEFYLLNSFKTSYK